MSAEEARERGTVEALRTKIRAAFPDFVFLGRVTPADDLTDEEYDEERELFRALHGKKWTELPAAVIKPFADILPLLSDEAFRTFLPAWLSGALDDPEMREPVVLNFDFNEFKKDTSFMDKRLRPMTDLQKATIQEFFSYLLAECTSDLEKESARGALEYMNTLS